MLCQMVISAVGIKQAAKGDWECQNGLGVGERDRDRLLKRFVKEASPQRWCLRKDLKERSDSTFSFQGKGTVGGRPHKSKV